MKYNMAELEASDYYEVQVIKTEKIDICHADSIRDFVKFDEKSIKTEKEKTPEETFTQSTSLKRHTIIHTEDKLHICPVCSKGFPQSSHLKRHMSIHTGERPHVCSVCSKRFKGKQKAIFK